MSWKKAPKEAEARKDFAERDALGKLVVEYTERIKELDELTVRQADTILKLEKDCDGRCEVAREEVRRLAAENERLSKKEKDNREYLNALLKHEKEKCDGLWEEAQRLAAENRWLRGQLDNWVAKAEENEE